MKKKAGRTPVKRAAKRTRKTAAGKLKHTPTPGLYGWITHTELASANPEATKAWCAKVLGWTFTMTMPTPTGSYHLFAYSEKGGGGVRKTESGEAPHSTFSVHVENTQTAFDKAIREGAQVIQPPTRVMEGVTIAVVREPGGVAVGLSGP